MKKISLLLVFTLVFTWAQAQLDTLTLSLEQVIAMAQDQSPNAAIAETRLSNNYWRYQSFLADYKPQIDLTLGSDLNRSINPITLPDGGINYIPQSYFQNNLNIGLVQDIASTGGSIFFRTGINRLDLFRSDRRPYDRSFLANPVSIDFVQPLFAFNALKWNKITEPLRFEESKRGYSEDMEEIAFQATQFFFNVLNAQLNLQAASRDKRNADTLYVLSQGRFEVGRIAEPELLQNELNAMNANADLAQQTLNLQTSSERLRDFLGIKDGVYFNLVPPTDIPDFIVDMETALQYAIKNRAQIIQFSLQAAEAERSVAQAKADRSPDLNLTGSFGLSQTASNFEDAYSNPLDQERVRLNLSVPLADWGKARSRMEIATSNQELTQLNIERDRVNFERDIIVKVQQFELIRNQVRLSQKAYDVAQST
ncbi:MAG: TolC family protein, partial [Bacteroidota bacterium]